MLMGRVCVVSLHIYGRRLKEEFMFFGYDYPVCFPTSFFSPDVYSHYNSIMFPSIGRHLPLTCMNIKLAQ